MAIKKILVTGSSGTIGTRLCEKLLEKKYEVAGADIQACKWSKRVDGLTKRIDLLDKKAVEKLPRDIDLVIHLAANARVYDLVVEPERAIDNITMLFNTLEFCRKNGIKRFMFASSRETYGNSGQAVHSEEDAKIDFCESPYSASKVSGEAFVRSYRQCYGMDFIITRFSNVYGMYDESNRVIPLFIRLTDQGKGLVVFGKEKMLDFTYIDDTVDGLLRCVEKFESAKNDVYNLATGEGFTILRTAELIQKNMGKKTPIEIKENRTGEVVQFIADITKARKKLGFEPKVSFEEGLRKTVEWYKEFLDKH